jgi:hypothetical protein
MEKFENDFFIQRNNSYRTGNNNIKRAIKTLWKFFYSGVNKAAVIQVENLGTFFQCIDFFLSGIEQKYTGVGKKNCQGYSRKSSTCSKIENPFL